MEHVTKSYRLKIYSNKNKSKRLDELLTFWKNQINKKITLFWYSNNSFSSFPPAEHTKGGRIIRDASVKAWQIVKNAKKRKQNMPIFKGNEIDLNICSAHIIKDLATKEFDIWFNVISIEKRKRLKLPCKKYEKFNNALEQGKMSKSFKIIKRKNNFYIQVYIDLSETKKENPGIVGLDVGLNHTVTTSDGSFIGDELKDLRIRTKWRRYTGLSAFKQRLNKVTRILVEKYPNCDFAVEKLLFKGKKKRNKMFRRRNNNWSYAYLSHHLNQMGYFEGFKVHFVNPEYSSQTCPICGFVSNLNRLNSDVFQCGKCGLYGNADHIGALNLAERVRQEYPSLQIIGGI